MHPHSPAPGAPDGLKTLLQVFAYLNQNLDIVTSLIDTTRTQITRLESELTTPLAQGKARKTLKNQRSRHTKKLRRCQSEAEMLTRVAVPPSENLYLTFRGIGSLGLLEAVDVEVAGCACPGLAGISGGGAGGGYIQE